MTGINAIFYIIVLIMSVVIHEVAHGYSAYLLGDKTAYFKGRLTLNPLKHLDPFGSVILPLILILTNSGFVIGWAKPVPYNPNNLKKWKHSELVVAISGIVANLLMALLFSIIIRGAMYLGLPVISDSLSLSPFYQITSIIVITNLVLAFFNLIPIPPLDGSKVLFSLLPARFFNFKVFLSRWGFFILIFFILFIWKLVAPFVVFLFSLLTGLAI